MVSQRVAARLPVLLEQVRGLQYAAARMPESAAREMALAVQFDHRRQVDPYGVPWAPVLEARALERGIDPDIYRPFDKSKSVRDSWQPAVEGDSAIIASDHHAAAALQKPYKRRRRRLMHPIPGQGLGAWEKRMQRMLGRLLRGAMMGEARRNELKMKAVIRREQRFQRRNEARIKAGLKPLRRRRVRALRGGGRG